MNTGTLNRLNQDQKRYNLYLVNSNNSVKLWIVCRVQGCAVPVVVPTGTGSRAGVGTEEYFDGRQQNSRRTKGGAGTNRRGYYQSRTPGARPRARGRGGPPN